MAPAQPREAYLRFAAFQDIPACGSHFPSSSGARTSCAKGPTYTTPILGNRIEIRVAQHQRVVAVYGRSMLHFLWKHFLSYNFDMVMYIATCFREKLLVQMSVSAACLSFGENSKGSPKSWRYKRKKGGKRDKNLSRQRNIVCPKYEAAAREKSDCDDTRVRPLLKQRQGREIRVSDNKPYFKFHLLLLPSTRLRPTHESTNARKSFFLLW